MLPELGFLLPALLAFALLSVLEASPLTSRRAPPLYPPPLPVVGTQLVSRVSSGQELPLNNVVRPSGRTMLVFLTHLGDLGSWELAQKLLYLEPQRIAAGCDLVAVCPSATFDSAKEFCAGTGFNPENLYIDFEAECYKRLEFSRGALADADVSPYLKLLPMLMGIQSEGTLPEVLRGYFGDPSADSRWIKQALRLVDTSRFDSVGRNGQRPFELATLRLQNMIDVLSKWQKLVPTNEEVLTLQGGAFALVDGKVTYAWKDTGILKYVDVARLAAAAGINA